MNLRTAKTIQDILWGVEGISLLLGYVLNRDLFVAAGVIVLILIFAVRAKFWKCPYCGKYIGRDLGYFCKNCGKELK